MTNEEYVKNIFKIVRKTFPELNIITIYKTSVGWLFSDGKENWPYRLSFLLSNYPELHEYIKTIKQGHIMMYIDDYFDLDYLLPIQLETIDLV